MALKKSNKMDSSFSMSSMTDIIFLLLLFFMIASTMSAPNDMKVNLPQSSANGAKPRQVHFEEIEPYLQTVYAADSTTYVALHADELVPYREIVKILDIANENRLKLVIATKVKE